jgi:hypothetical protein
MEVDTSDYASASDDLTREDAISASATHSSAPGHSSTDNPYDADARAVRRCLEELPVHLKSMSTQMPKVRSTLSEHRFSTQLAEVMEIASFGGSMPTVLFWYLDYVLSTNSKFDVESFRLVMGVFSLIMNSDSKGHLSIKIQNPNVYTMGWRFNNYLTYMSNLNSLASTTETIKEHPEKLWMLTTECPSDFIIQPEGFMTDVRDVAIILRKLQSGLGGLIGSLRGDDRILGGEELRVFGVPQAWLDYLKHSSNGGVPVNLSEKYHRDSINVSFENNLRFSLCLGIGLVLLNTLVTIIVGLWGC